MLDYGNPDPAGESIPAPTAVVGKRKAILDQAQTGALPQAPDFSIPTHARFRAKLAQIVALAKAGDIAGLQAFEIHPGFDSAMKAAFERLGLADLLH